MKKILTLLLTLFMAVALVGCDFKNEETPTIDEPQTEEPVVVGGYQEVEDKNLTPDLIEMFEKAFDGFTGASYTPVMLEATQVVAGTNYKFMADGFKTTNPMIQGSYYVYVNKDLQGNISLLDIEVIEEHEIKEFKPEVELDTELNKDLTNMSFWVVFYDQYGNVLQKEALKYGTIPTFKGSYPEGFDSWDKALTAIKGNTYIRALCHEVKPKNNTPIPEEDNTLHKGNIICIPSENLGYKYYFVLKIDGDEATLVNLDYKAETKFSNSNSDKYAGSLLDIACNTTFYGGLSSTLQDAIVEKTISLNQYTYDDTNYDQDTHPFEGELSSKVTLGTIDRKVYALDIEDIEGYFSSTHSIDDILEITNEKVWLRSIADDDLKSWYISNAAIEVDYRSKWLPPLPFDVEKSVRPSLVLDLTKDIDYEKKTRVKISSFSDDLFASAYADKGDTVVDLNFYSGSDLSTFIELSKGLNIFYMLETDGQFVPVFVATVNQILGIFNHNELISIEKQLSEDMRVEYDPDDYDDLATTWTDINWDEITSDYDSRMISELICSLKVIDDYYDANSAVYDIIINKMKPYFVTSDLKVTDNIIIRILN